MRHIFSCIIFFLLTISTLKASTFRGVHNDIPADRWEDAFLSGNGQSGIMVFGNPKDDTIIFNHHSFLRPKSLPEIPNMVPVLESTRDKMIGGDIYGGWNDFYNYMKNNGPEKWKKGDILESSQVFHPGYNLKIIIDENGRVSNYRHECNYETGEIIVKWDDARGSWERKTFVSRAEDVIITFITKPSSSFLNCKLSLKPSMNHPHYIEHETINSHFFLNFRAKYNEIDGARGGYEGVTRVITKGESAKSDLEEGDLRIRNADSVPLLTKLARYKKDYNEWDKLNLQTELNQLSKDYNQLLAQHVDIHGEMFNRVRYDLNVDETEMNKTAVSLIKDQNANTSVMNKALLEKTFDTSRYLFMCSSGPTHGPRLTGVFLGDWNAAAWDDDYIVNVNFTLQIGGGNIANLAEAMEGSFRVLERSESDWEKAAKSLWGCRGIVGPVRMDGEQAIYTNLSDWYAHNASTGYGPWVVYSMYEHYQITGDLDFLKNRVYPFLYDMAIFYEDFLSRTDNKGKVIFVPSSSPENSSSTSGHKTSASINATFDIAACKHALNMAIESANVLGLEQGKGEGVERWTALLEKMPEYRLLEDGTLKEWAWDIDESYGHRHTSHGYTVWPAYEINPEDPKTAGLVDAVKLALAKRNKPIDQPQAHGNLMLMYCEIRTKQAEKFGDRLLGLMTNKHHYNSLATSHDKNLGVGYLDAYNYDFICSIQGHLIESAVFTNPGILELLPAMPSYLETGSLTGIKGRNRTTIDKIEWNLDDNSVICEFRSDITQDLKLIYRNGIDSIDSTVPITGSGIYGTVSVVAGVPVILKVNVVR